MPFIELYQIALKWLQGSHGHGQPENMRSEKSNRDIMNVNSVIYFFYSTYAATLNAGVSHENALVKMGGEVMKISGFSFY